MMISVASRFGAAFGYDRKDVSVLKGPDIRMSELYEFMSDLIVFHPGAV